MQTNTVHYLKDYRAPDYLVRQTDLTFDIFDDYTRVQSRLLVEPQQAGALLLEGTPPGVVSPSELQEHGGQSQSHSCGGSFSSGVMEMALAGPTVQLRKETFPLGG